MGTPRVFDFGDGLFFGGVLFAGALFGVFDAFLVLLVADAVFARTFWAVAVVREDGFRRMGFFVRTLAGFFFDVAIGLLSHPAASASARSGPGPHDPTPGARGSVDTAVVGDHARRRAGDLSPHASGFRFVTEKAFSSTGSTTHTHVGSVAWPLAHGAPFGGIGIWLVLGPITKAETVIHTRGS